MTDEHGRFCWYELMTSDVAAASRFYEATIGWAGKGAQGAYFGVASWER